MAWCTCGPCFLLGGCCGKVGSNCNNLDRETEMLLNEMTTTTTTTTTAAATAISDVYTAGGGPPSPSDVTPVGSSS